MERKDREAVERELEQRATEEKRQWSGSTPTEDVMERALDADEEDAPERREEEEPKPADGGR